MARKPQNGKCIYCLTDAAPRTWDHVFPQSWYPDTTPNDIEKWKVPVCFPCNNKYSAIEQDLLLRLGLCIDPNSEESAGIVDKALRSLAPELADSERERAARKAKRDKILRQSLLGTKIPTNSIYPNFEEKWGRPEEQQIGIPIPKKSVDLIFEKIIKGITFLESGKYIEPPYSINLYPLKEEDKKTFTDLLEKFGKVYSRPPGIIVRRATAFEDNISSVYEIVIWGVFKTYAVVNDSTNEESTLSGISRGHSTERAPTKPTALPHPPVLLAAITWMTGALIVFTGMAIAARELSADLSTIQILAVRSVTGVLIVSALLQRSGWSQLSTTHLKLHLLRNIAQFGGQFSWLYAIAAIPLATVFAIEFTAPIWTAIFAALLLGERITARRVLAITCGLIGVLLILRPGASLVHPAALVMLAGAVSFGLAYTMTKKLTGRDSFLSILFWMSVLQLPVSVIPALWHWTPLTLAHAPWLLLIGCGGLAAHYCLVRALSLADATVVVTLDFLRLPLVTLIGFWVYHEPADWYLAAGAVLILAGNLVNVIGGPRRA